MALSFQRSLFLFAFLSSLLLSFFPEQDVYSLGLINPHVYPKLSGRRITNKLIGTNKTIGRHRRRELNISSKYTAKHTKSSKLNLTANKKEKAQNKKLAVPNIAKLVRSLHSQTIVPGVIYKTYRGTWQLNILDIDPSQSDILIKPIIADEHGPRLRTVKEHALSHNAIAAINANYFKNTGTPLGTLIIDGEWIVGPLYERVALGITKSGYMRMDRVGLSGMLYTSNEKAPKIWINNVNEPRRTGSHIIAYTKRWGKHINLAYDGCLVAIDAKGKVIAFSQRELDIPDGGIVLTDSKDSILSSLQIGDNTSLKWHVTPDAWDDVVDAISGGPMLLKDGHFCLNLEAEKFRNNWTSNKIQARTACAITANNHLILATVEGPHTLFDLTYILRQLGAVDAMNLDGGGSTTMVIRNKIANIENKSQQRKVAAALGIFEINKKDESPSEL